MKKPLAILLLTAGLVLGGCQKEPSTDITPTPAAPSSTEPAQKAVDYGVYTALLESYDIASRETYDGSRPPLPEEIAGGLPQDRVHTDGLNDAQLVDFDGDGVYELVLAYIEFDSWAELWDIQYGQFAPVRVFALGEGGELHHIDNFSLFLMQDAECNMELSVEFVEVEGKSYVITGFQDDSYYHSTTATVWEYTLFGFEEVVSLYAAYGEELGDWGECMIDGETVSASEFDQAYNHWIAPKTSTVVWEATQEDEALSAQHLRETAEFLSDYPRAQGDFGVAVFGENGRFVLFEDSPETPVEALARDNYATSILKGASQDGESEFIPSYIIRDFSTVSAPEYGYETVLLAEDIAKYLADNPVENHICVRLDVKPVMDFSVSQYDPQTGYAPYLEWMLFAEEEADFTLEQTFTNLFHQGPYGVEDPFHISWLGSARYVADEMGQVTIESLENNTLLWNILWYLDWEELTAIPILDFGGDEYILVECIYDSMNVHPLVCPENPVGGSYTGPVIVATHGNEKEPDVRFDCRSPAGNLYTYQPVVGEGYRFEYGNYGTEHQGMEWRSADQDSDKPSAESTMYGITFLGYEGVEAITPPYAYIPMEDMEILESCLHQGDEYFLIVPNSETAVIAVYDLDPNDSIGGIGTLLHQTSPGVPLILRCNLSDIHQNTAVRIQDGEEYATFSPYVDLMSGTAHVEEQGYEMNTDSPQYTEDERLEGIVEVVGEDYLLGRVFLRQADEVIFDQTCAVYALGTDTPEKFTTEEFLAISDDGTVYWYDVLSASWLGWSVQN